MGNSKFLKVSDQITFKPKYEGLDYELEANMVYRLTYNRYTENFSLQKIDQFTMPEKIYSTKTDTDFINKVVHRYNISKSGILGVMFSGLKGSGKTLTMKRIALMSQLPIIVMDEKFPTSKYKELIDKLGDTQVCFMFDEFDKVDINMRELLEILDGLNTKGKHMMLMSCNEPGGVNNFLKDRCSRIRYWKEFDKIPVDLLKKIVQDMLNNKSNVDKVINFIIDNFTVLSFDNISSFIDDINTFEDDSLEDLFEDMNLTRSKNALNKPIENKPEPIKNDKGQRETLDDLDEVFGEEDLDD